MQTASKHKTQQIVVALDAILDTRLGTLAKLDPELAAQALENGYHHRLYDSFGPIGLDEFKELYSQRDKETLKFSVPTRILKFLREMCEAILEGVSLDPTMAPPEIVLNVYPYELTEEEMDVMGQAVRVHVSDVIPVTVTRKEWKEFNPRYCRDEVYALILYDYNEWMEENTPMFEKCVCPQVTLFGPAIFFDKEHDKEAIEKITTESMNPFEAIQFLANPIIGLSLIDAKEFSVYK